MDTVSATSLHGGIEYVITDGNTSDTFSIGTSDNRFPYKLTQIQG